MMRRDAVKALVEEHGPEGYLKFQAALLEGRELDNGRKIKKRPQDFSLRALWEGLVGPIEETLSYAMQGAGLVEIPAHLEESVTSSAFPSATGQLIAAKVIEGYEDSPGIGDRLVTIMPSSLRGERIVGFTSLQGPKVVEEGEEYEGSTYGEKYVTTQEFKKGRLLEITEEAVFFDQTGEVLRRAGALGEMAAQERERVIIRGVADVNSTERVYRPTGTAEQLYASGNNNLLSTATPLNDWTDVQEVMEYHALNVSDDREADDALGQQPILWQPLILLTAVKLAGVSARTISATQVRGTQGSNEELISGNPLNTIVPNGMMALSSPFLDQAAADSDDDQYTDADDWFIGDFKKQFIWKEIWPLQTFRAPAQNPEQFRRDVVAGFKVRYYGGINAIDERYVIQVNAV